MTYEVRERNGEGMTYEELVAECKRFRHEAEQLEARFFVFLMKCEKEHADVWRGAGCATFEQFIRSNNLCQNESRYLAFRDGCAKCGVDMAVEHGVHWTIALGKLREEMPEEMVARAQAFVQIHHTAPSEQQVRDWVRDLPKDKPVADVNIRRVDELAKLREENRLLRAELSNAKREIAMLQKKLEGRQAKHTKKQQEQPSV